MIQTWGQVMPPSTPLTPGQGFLRVTGILYIVFSGVVLFFFAIMLAIMEFWLPYVGGGALTQGAWIVQSVIGILQTFYRIFIGIMGVANCKKAYRAGLLLVLGIGDIALMLASTMFAVIYMGFYNYMSGFSWFTALLGLTLPTLYIIGAVKNKANQNKDLRGM